ncbi:MAG: ABC transporter transmembrane domain-containing protein [Noviherbaspirillum sp.]
MKSFWESLWDDARPYLAALAGFSFAINLLYLVPALFTLHVFDRVLPANSRETLVMLLLATGAALAVLVVLDYLRSRLQYLAGSLLNERLAPAVVETVVAHLARAPQYSGVGAVRDVATVRSLFASQGLQALCDAPWAPLFILLIWSFHPLLGLGAALAGALMLLLAWLNDRTSHSALEHLQKEGRTVSRYLESALRNAEVLQALGMTGELLARWRAQEDRLGALQDGAGKRGMLFASATRGARQAIQSGMLALGAWLVLTEHASPGVMIATTILLSRVVQPVEQLVGAWRVLAEARAAWLRLRALSAEFRPAQPLLSLSRPAGRLVVERLGFFGAGRQQLLLISASCWKPGRRWRWWVRAARASRRWRAC